MGCPISFSLMWNQYPAKEQRGETNERLYTELGWTDLIGQKEYDNTCAVRLSLCLARSGVPFSRGDLTVRAGPMRGQKVLVSVRALADHLKQLWGAPEVLRPVNLGDLSGRDGVLAFFDLPSGYPAHIDLVRGAGMCRLGCHFGAREGWLWPCDRP